MDIITGNGFNSEIKEDKCSDYIHTCIWIYIYSQLYLWIFNYGWVDI